MSIANSPTPLASSTLPVPTVPPRAAEATNDLVIYPLSVHQYHEMIRQEILGEDDPVELLEGYLVKKMTKNPPHEFAAGQLHELLLHIVSAGFFVRSQGPISTSDSEPEPDVSIVRGNRRDFAGRHPQPADSALVVEVADSSLQRDRGLKKRIYARAAVPQYWIVNLVEKQIEVYSDPTGPADAPDYRQLQVFASGSSVPVVIDGQAVGQLGVSQILP